jgi:hypothetical protein
MRVVKISDILDEVIPCTELPILIINDLSCWYNQNRITYNLGKEKERTYWIRLNGMMGAVFSSDEAFVFNPQCYDDMYGFCLKQDAGKFLRYIPHYNDGGISTRQ